MVDIEGTAALDNESCGILHNTIHIIIMLSVRKVDFP